VSSAAFVGRIRPRFAVRDGISSPERGTSRGEEAARPLLGCFGAEGRRMPKSRVEAFSDGVLAIIITIMVLELKVPHGQDFSALRPLVPLLLSYLLSFVYVGIYWNNHHHLLHAAKRVDGRIMWANLHLLFWLSLIPVVTGWVGEGGGARVPAVLYGGVLFMAGVAYYILERTILTRGGAHPRVAEALGRDAKGLMSLVLYLLAIAVAFVFVWAAHAIYALVAVMWMVPDRRLERVLGDLE
jgi:uncharacterized membrane protein